MSMGIPPIRDRINARTPLRCPVCETAPSQALVRDLGGVTGGLVWELHAIECVEHGWFQTEVISRPPREIFPVDRPFGVARRLVIDGKEIFSFPTAWNDLPLDEQLQRATKRTRVDPFDPTWWRVTRRIDSNSVHPDVREQ